MQFVAGIHSRRSRRYQHTININALRDGSAPRSQVEHPEPVRALFWPIRGRGNGPVRSCRLTTSRQLPTAGSPPPTISRRQGVDEERILDFHIHFRMFPVRIFPVSRYSRKEFPFPAGSDFAGPHPRNLYFFSGRKGGISSSKVCCQEKFVGRLSSAPSSLLPDTTSLCSFTAPFRPLTTHQHEREREIEREFVGQPSFSQSGVR